MNCNSPICSCARSVGSGREGIPRSAARFLCSFQVPEDGDVQYTGSASHELGRPRTQSSRYHGHHIP